MDLEYTLRNTIWHQSQNVASSFSIPIPSFLEPIFPILFASFLIGIFNYVLKNAKELGSLFRNRVVNILRWNQQENCIILTYSDSFTNDNLYKTSRFSFGFHEVQRYIQSKAKKIGNIYIGQEDTQSIGTYFPEKFTNVCIDEERKIYASGDAEQDIVNNNFMIKSKLRLWSLCLSETELLEWIQEIVRKANVTTEINKVYAFRTYFEEGHVHFENTKVFFPKRELLEGIILPNKQKKQIYQYMNKFTNESWFIEKNIPYKATFLFHGPPGTGKTTLIKNISQATQRHIVLMNLNDVNEEQFNKTFWNYRFKNDFDKFIYVFEEIDTQIECILEEKYQQKSKGGETKKEKGDENGEEKRNQSIRLGTILQALDGVIETHGLIIIATTNHFDKLTPAFIRRFHCQMELSYLTYETMNDVKERYYGESLSLEEWKSMENQKIAPNRMIEACCTHETWSEAVMSL